MMETQPLVSVIMPCYNMERFISYTIDSVQRQTYSFWELLIVDDASTDQTAATIRKIAAQDNRIRFVEKPTHSGIADTRNQCIQMAQGHYLAFLDADDLWHPEKLEVQLQFMTEQKIGFCYSSYDCIDENGASLNKIIKAANNLNYEQYLRNTIIGCSTVMVDIQKVGSISVPDFRTSEDTATWLDLLKKGFVAYAINLPLTSYRIRKNSASSNKLKAAADLWKVYRQHEKLTFIKASCCFYCYVFNAIKKRM